MELLVLGSIVWRLVLAKQNLDSLRRDYYKFRKASRRQYSSERSLQTLTIFITVVRLRTEIRQKYLLAFDVVRKRQFVTVHAFQVIELTIKLFPRWKTKLILHFVSEHFRTFGQLEAPNNFAFILHEVLSFFAFFFYICTGSTSCKKLWSASQILRLVQEVI